MDQRKSLDLDAPPSTSRKVRFAPKGPPKRNPKPVEHQTEVAGPDDSDDNKASEALRRRVYEHLGRRGPKVEKKSSVQVAFTHGVASSSSTRSHGKPSEGGGDASCGLDLNDTTVSDNGQNLVAFSSTTGADGAIESLAVTANALSQKKKKKYREPWDCHHTNYPVTLPFRRPYSGNPELLDKAEFGEDASNLEYNENTIHAASELGLLEENEDVQMLFLQLPPNLPLFKRPTSAEEKETTGGLEYLGSRNAPSSTKGKEIAETVASTRSKGKEIASSVIPSRDSGVLANAKGKERVDYSVSSGKGNAQKKGCSLDELPAGFMGKMLVYKSGAIKLKLGENLYDVSPGLDTIFAQDVVAINTKDKHCCVVAELGKRAVATPNIDSVLDTLIELD